MKTFFIYIVIAVTGGVEVKINTTIPPFYNLNECKQYVVKNSPTILSSAQSAFKGKKILEMGCVEIKKDGSKFSPSFREDTSI